MANPQANATLDRVHQVVGNCIRVSMLLTNWTQQLQAIAWSLRSSHLRLLNCFPAMFLFGRDMISPFKPQIRENKQHQVDKDVARQNKGRRNQNFEENDEFYL